MVTKIETSRLVLRTMDPGNIKDVLGALYTMGDSDTAWWADVNPLEDLDEASDFIYWGNTNMRGITQFAVCEKESGRILGLLQVVETHALGLSAAELGYAMRYEGRGKGYMTEAVKAVCEVLFEDPTMMEVRCEILPFNEGSKGVVRRCGFSKVEEKKNEKERRYLDAAYLDEYVLTAHEYRKRMAGFDYSYLDTIDEEEDLYERLAA